jgi:aspartyl aminopeptidase
MQFSFYIISFSFEVVPSQLLSLTWKKKTENAKFYLSYGNSGLFKFGEEVREKKKKERTFLIKIAHIPSIRINNKEIQ